METRERTAHAPTQVFGLALLTAAALAATIVSLLFTEGEGTFLPIAVIAAVATWVVWRFDRMWATIVGIIGTLATFMGLWFLAFGLFQVFSPIEFVVGLMLVLGFFISLTAGIMVLVARARDRTHQASDGIRFRKTVMGVLGVLAVVSIAGFMFTRSTVSDEDAEGTVAVDMTNFEFRPGIMTVSQGQNLLVTNRDPFAHDFVIEEHGISEYFGPGNDGVVDLSTVPAGRYQYFCSFHTDPSTGDGMTGELIIES